jgi:hypothetical protein
MRGVDELPALFFRNQSASSNQMAASCFAMIGGTTLPRAQNLHDDG